MRIRWIGMLAAMLLSALPATAQQRIALTFDDAPRERGAFLTPDRRTVMLIAALHRAGVRQAAFFVNPGNFASGDGVGGEDRLAAYVAAGHVLADHSDTHLALSKTTATAYLADIDKAEAWLKRQDGYRPWFRFPYLDEGGADKAKRDAVRAGLKARGMTNGYVTLDGSDWQLEGLAQAAARAGQKMDMAGLRTLYVDMMMEGVETHAANAAMVFGAKQPIHVMLLHETDLAALFIGDFVHALQAKGWTIVTADAAYADPVGRIPTDPAQANGTLVNQIAQTRHLPERRWPAMGDAATAKRLFDQRVLAPARR